MQMLSKGAVHPAIEVKIATFAAVWEMMFAMELIGIKMVI